MLAFLCSSSLIPVLYTLDGGHGGGSTIGKEIVRMETSNKDLRFVIPIEPDTVGCLPKLMRAVYQVLLDARARNMVHQFFAKGMALHNNCSKHVVVESTKIVHTICSVDPPCHKTHNCAMIFALHEKQDRDFCPGRVAAVGLMPRSLVSQG